MKTRSEESLDEIELSTIGVCMLVASLSQLYKGAIRHKTF